MILFVQFLEVQFCGRRGVVVDDLLFFRINDNRTIVRIAIEEFRSILEAEITPVIAKNGVADIRRTVLHLRVSLQITLNQIKILIHCRNLRVIRPFQNAALNPECFVVMYSFIRLPPKATELRDVVDVAMYLFDLRPLQFCKHVLDVRILVNFVIQFNECASLNQLRSRIATLNEIRVIVAGNQSTDSFFYCPDQ
jgi:hypothetical protein